MEIKGQSSSMSDICSTKGHSFYVCETVGVESTGTVSVLMICTRCGEGKQADFKVAPDQTPFVLLRKKE